MPWERSRSSRRRLELPPDWYSRIRPRILRRDHHHCRWGSLPEDHYPEGMCPTVANQVDHCGDSDDHRDGNLRALCEYHHRVRTGRQGQTAQVAEHRRVKALRYRPEEPHPGGAA